ncbi:hypothetical protein NQ317_018825 [Molorchus minor]|uniref:ZP domain-containing protein n=1 Tax=Molorchus minor TaxID=1323400 RepID=A0ABQ9ISN4_9CUCU|nr:hypothetical protein NQ317_018825 [Molorchus minor]
MAHAYAQDTKLHLINMVATTLRLSREYAKIYYRNDPVKVGTYRDIEAECQDDYMKIRVGFNGTFTGLVYSAGYAYDPDCMYINGTGRDYYEFFIQLNRCGTLGKNTHNEDNRKTPTIC